MTTQPQPDEKCYIITEQEIKIIFDHMSDPTDDDCLRHAACDAFAEIRSRPHTPASELFHCEVCHAQMEAKAASEARERVLDELYGISDTPIEDFLEWVADRFVFVYKEKPNVDFVLSLRKRAEQARSLRRKEES